MTYLVYIHRLDGKCDCTTVQADTETKAAATAFARLGYSGGALAAVDYWEAREQPVEAKEGQGK